jgi:pimeloyl-ACP methyl ester carboxylesterase
VGHSLGAGLAQLAALAQRRGPRIAKVFAFDPSPVTGARLVDDATKDRNVRGKAQGRGLEIDRIYQPGEILEPVRAYFGEEFPTSDQRCEPLVRTDRFDVNQQRGLIGQHYIRGPGGFAYGIVDTSYGGSLSVPPKIGDCPTRYRRPTTDEDVVASAASGHPVYARAGSVATVAGSNRHSSRSAAARLVLVNAH